MSRINGSLLLAIGLCVACASVDQAPKSTLKKSPYTKGLEVALWLKLEKGPQGFLCDSSAFFDFPDIAINRGGGSYVALRKDLLEYLKAKLNSVGSRVVAKRTPYSVTLDIDAAVGCNTAFSGAYQPFSTTNLKVTRDGKTLKSAVIDIPPQDGVDTNSGAGIRRHIDYMASDIVSELASAPQLAQIPRRPPKPTVVASRAPPPEPIPAPKAPEPLPPVVLRQPASILVMELQLTGPGIPAHVPELVTRLLQAELDNVGGLKTVGSEDIKAMLDVEKRKDMLGCETTACIAEIAGALGTDLVLHGQLGLLGSRYSINVSVVDGKSASVRGRVSLLVPGTEDAIADLVPSLARNVVEKLNEAD